MASFSTEIWTPGLTPNPSQPGRRELIMAANKTSKKSGGFRISTKKNSTHSSNSVFHPDEADSGAESESEKPAEKRPSVIPQIRSSQPSTPTSGSNSPQTPTKKGNILYRIFHPQDEPNGFFGTSRRSYHSSDDDDSDNVESSDVESERDSRSSLPRVRKNELLRRNSNTSSNSSNDGSESESDEKRRPRGSIFKDLMKLNRASSSSEHSHSDSEDDSDTQAANRMLKGLSLRKKEDYKIDNSGAASPPMSRTNSESSLSEKYGKKDEVLGRGANAVVRLCQPVNSDKKYAIKEFRKRKQNETQKEYVKKLVAEFCISSTLEHENIVRTVDLIQDDRKQWCVVMEYCSCGDLYTRVHSGTLTEPDEFNCYFKQLLHGVSYLHSMGVAHRDLKPENLLITNGGRTIKITDFGVSEVFRTPFCNSTKKAKGLCGSGPYIAPEEFESKEYDPEAVDVWACGIIYYVLAFQSIPWRSATLSDSRFKFFMDNYGHFWPFDRLVPGMRKLMYRILEPNSAKRITVEDILEDPFMKKVCVCSANKESNHTHIVVTK